ncbi:hypothetical protein L3067_01500 [Xanthomonas sp. PPL568]|uniref:hypothetical protein n=1 Tax=Xanthomonas indica TaxID=2912242 RepID=UPI001F582B9E|nr:hypothetical protein [Xanthomonas indica]MCI2243285.1 hypothetical protein [Xanthomonas indica]
MRRPEEAIAAARGLLKVPWLHQGRNPRVGIDCAGLLVLAYALDYDHTSYSTHPHRGLLEQQLERALGVTHRLERPNVSAADLCLGDVLAMTSPGGRTARHVALVGDYVHGGPSIIHTDAALGRVVECALDSGTVSQIDKVYSPWAALQGK